MSYKTILVHVDASPHCEQRVRAAAALAVQHQAHLIGAAMTGISHYIYSNDNIDFSQMVVAMHVEAMQEKALAALQRFEALAAEAGVDSVETRFLNDDPENALAMQARYADLVVVSQTDIEDAEARLTPGFTSLCHAHQRPPGAGGALRGRLPCPGQPGPGGLGRRHGSHARPGQRPAHAGAGRASDGGRVQSGRRSPRRPAGRRHRPVPGAARREGRRDRAAYPHQRGRRPAFAGRRPAERPDRHGRLGHTRLRELLLGGVTDTILRTMTAPVLMAH
ncbi:universal stress protein [Massilia sp. B-10]|nr:universal stress protein [Massilia sp. B-10]